MYQHESLNIIIHSGWSLALILMKERVELTVYLKEMPLNPFANRADPDQAAPCLIMVHCLLMEI